MIDGTRQSIRSILGESETHTSVPAQIGKPQTCRFIGSCPLIVPLQNLGQGINGIAGQLGVIAKDQRGIFRYDVLRAFRDLGGAQKL